MEHYDLRGQRSDMKHKGRNVVWSIAMDKCLIESLALQARNGNKVDKSFNENAYSVACAAVNSRFKLNLNNQKVINRLKTLKKRYKIMRDMLSQDGFRWNPKSRMIECDDDDLWKTYITANPDARGFRGKQIDMYDELRIVCGNCQVPCRWSKMKEESYLSEIKSYEEDSTSFLSRSSEESSDTDGTESYSGSPTYTPNGKLDENQEPPLAQPIKRHKKRPRSSDILQEAMLAVAASIRRLADAIERNKSVVNPPELLQAVMEIDGLGEAKQMYAFEYLNADPVKARAFMTYDARMRKLYLLRQFWWWK